VQRAGRARLEAVAGLGARFRLETETRSATASATASHTLSLEDDARLHLEGAALRVDLGPLPLYLTLVEGVRLLP
jgi:hypothetical protein